MSPKISILGICLALIGVLAATVPAGAQQDDRFDREYRTCGPVPVESVAINSPLIQTIGRILSLPRGGNNRLVILTPSGFRQTILVSSTTRFTSPIPALNGVGMLINLLRPRDFVVIQGTCGEQAIVLAQRIVVRER